MTIYVRTKFFNNYSNYRFATDRATDTEFGKNQLKQSIRIN